MGTHLRLQTICDSGCWRNSQPCELETLSLSQCTDVRILSILSLVLLNLFSLLIFIVSQSSSGMHLNPVRVSLQCNV